MQRQEDHQEDQAMLDPSNHGNIAGAIRHGQHAKHIHQAEARERVLRNAERFEKESAARDLKHGIVYGNPYVAHNAKVHQHRHPHGIEGALHQFEQHEEPEAAWDLRHGSAAGAVRNEQHAKDVRHAKYGYVSQPPAPAHAHLHHRPVYVEQKGYSRRCTTNCTIS
jgi:hypothetical protein